MLAFRRERGIVTTWHTLARNRALHHLANEKLSADLRYQLAQVVCGYRPV